MPSAPSPRITPSRRRAIVTQLVLLSIAMISGLLGESLALIALAHQGDNAIIRSSVFISTEILLLEAVLPPLGGIVLVILKIAAPDRTRRAFRRLSRSRGGGRVGLIEGEQVE